MSHTAPPILHIISGVPAKMSRSSKRKMSDVLAEQEETRAQTSQIVCIVKGYDPKLIGSPKFRIPL
jgi:hypothetical protein